MRIDERVLNRTTLARQLLHLVRGEDYWWLRTPALGERRAGHGPEELVWA